MRQKRGCIPTNVITGFLGVGKTTAIRHLLDAKPASEIWAVLVNEFGEIGLDAELLKGNHAQDKGVVIREVPGGCMCCASGLPMQVALNQLIKHSEPDRLIIEPTGLGHPQEVLDVLSNETYQNILDLKATITLVDARKISDVRYTEHEIFQQQLQVADVIIANKSDLYQEHHLGHLKQYLHKLGLASTTLETSTQGNIGFPYLTQSCKQTFNTSTSHLHTAHAVENSSFFTSDIAPPSTGYIRKDNEGDGFYSSGWIFSSLCVFDKEKLQTLFLDLKVARLKAIFATSQGGFSFNKVDEDLTVIANKGMTDSRIEVIGRDAQTWKNLESQLLQAKL